MKMSAEVLTIVLLLLAETELLIVATGGTYNTEGLVFLCFLDAVVKLLVLIVILRHPPPNMLQDPERSR